MATIHVPILLMFRMEVFGETKQQILMSSLFQVDCQLQEHKWLQFRN